MKAVKFGPHDSSFWTSSVCCALMTLTAKLQCTLRLRLSTPSGSNEIPSVLRTPRTARFKECKSLSWMLGPVISGTCEHSTMHSQAKPWQDQLQGPMVGTSSSGKLNFTISSSSETLMLKSLQGYCFNEFLPDLRWKVWQFVNSLLAYVLF